MTETCQSLHKLTTSMEGAGRAALLLAALGLSASPALLAQDATFEPIVASAVLCRADIDPRHFHAWFNAIKPAYKREQGAYWFRVSGQIFGVPLTEAFVSDGTSDHDFVGVVTSLPPAQLAEALGQAGAARFEKRWPADRYPAYRSASGAEIVHSGAKAKLFCRRDRPIP